MDVAPSFDSAWESFRARTELRLVGDATEAEWSHGRAQFLAFIAHVEDPAARDHLARVSERLAGIPGVEPHPDWSWHVTLKGAGFQVIKRTRDDDVLRQDVPRVAGKARALLTKEPAFDVQLGLVNAFADVVFVEVRDEGRLRQLNDRLVEGISEVSRYPTDGPGFLPHVSVARFTSNDGLDRLKSAIGELRGEGPGPGFVVRRAEFIKAWLLEEMSEFETLATYALSGTG